MELAAKYGMISGKFFTNIFFVALAYSEKYLHDTSRNLHTSIPIVSSFIVDLFWYLNKDL